MPPENRHHLFHRFVPVCASRVDPAAVIAGLEVVLRFVGVGRDTFPDRGLVDARKEFFAALKGIRDPEEKREAITRVFYRNVLGRIVSESGAKCLLQGTILTDIEETVAETQKVLKRLIQEGLVVKSGSFFHVQDFLFRFWMREVYLRRHSLFLPEERSLRKHLFDELSRILESCERMSDEDIGLRVESLLKEFRNDTLEIEQKKVQCPQFSEIVIRTLSRSVVSILARGGRGRWLFHVCPEWLGESEIEVLVQDAKHLRKIRKKILVAPGGIDQNAKLIAQEAKMQMWDLRYLNTFMDFYDLPKIIVSSRPKANDHKKTDGSFVGSVAQGVPASELS